MHTFIRSANEILLFDTKQQTGLLLFNFLHKIAVNNLTGIPFYSEDLIPLWT